MRLNSTYYKLHTGKESILYSLIITMLILIVTASLVSFAFSPHTIFDLLTTTKIEIHNAAGDIVHERHARINRATIPNLQPGIYLLYIDGQHRETFAIEKDETPETPIIGPKVRMRNIDGIVAVQWEIEKQPKTYNHTIDIDTWLKEQIIILSEINVSILTATIIMCLLLLTFNAAALAVSSNKSNLTFYRYVLNGSTYFFEAVKVSFLWTILFGVVIVPLAATLSMYSLSNLNAGLITFSVFFIIQQINKSPLYVSIIMSAVLGLASTQISETASIILLVAAIHIISPLAAKSTDVLSEIDDTNEEEQSWKDSLS